MMDKDLGLMSCAQCLSKPVHSYEYGLHWVYCPSTFGRNCWNGYYSMGEELTYQKAADKWQEKMREQWKEHDKYL